MLVSWNNVEIWVAGIIQGVILWKIFDVYSRKHRAKERTPSNTTSLRSLNQHHRAWLAAEAIGAIPEMGLRCPKCQYNLTGLLERVCPECGTAFTLTDLVRTINDPVAKTS